MTNKNFTQQGTRQQFDVIVIGSGIAGITYILELLKHTPNSNIALISKKELSESNSQYAQGGIAATLEELSAEKHIQDTLKAGDGLCRKETVEQVIQQSHKAVEILKEYGVQFEDSLSKEGGHSERRILHIGDHTGKAIMTALLNKLHNTSVKIFEYHTAVSLITQNKAHLPGSPKETIGAYVLNEKTKKIHTMLAKAVVLATGGAGKIYRYTSNPETATGDGIAMAYRAGARIGNMEFYQFHPTLLYHRKLNNFLITEALRGEGAHLLNADTQQRFMADYAPNKMELATRDVVARAIFSEIERSEKSYVYLDVRHLDEQFLIQRFPSIHQALKQLDINMHTDLIPVVPAAHYLCGGILADLNGHTDIKRLYAIGETAFTGLHGANRLASNSLLEATIMGMNAATSSKQLLQEELEIYQNIKDWDSQSVVDQRRASQIHAHWRGLRGEMNSYAGIVRTEAGLKDLLKLIHDRREMIENYYWQHLVTTDIVELRNIALIADLIVYSAIRREESRGGHYREDHLEKMLNAEESIVQYRKAQIIS